MSHKIWVDLSLIRKIVFGQKGRYSDVDFVVNFDVMPSERDARDLVSVL